MSSFSEKSIEKRLNALSGTQDSIQGLSLWILHHKAHSVKIAQVWLKEGKKASPKDRLTYLYLCNEIVQTCVKKRAAVFKESFKQPLKEILLTFVNEDTLLPKLTRIVTIWVERKVYDTDYLAELTKTLEHVANGTGPAAAVATNNISANSAAASDDDARILTEFQPSILMELILTFKSLEDQVELKRRQITTMQLDVSSQDAVKKLKDRSHGSEFSHQFEDSCQKLDEYVIGLEREIEQRARLIELLEQSELFYDAQYGEARSVVVAYKNFGTRVNAQKKKLAEHRKTLPDPDSPIPSPVADAPSPGNTPPHLKTVDNNEVADMELSDDENAAKVNGKNGNDSPPSPVGSPLDVKLSPTHITPRGSGTSGCDVIMARCAGGTVGGAYIPAMAAGAAKSFLAGESGSTTPVMDETQSDDASASAQVNTTAAPNSDNWQSWTGALPSNTPSGVPPPADVTPPMAPPVAPFGGYDPRKPDAAMQQQQYNPSFNSPPAVSPHQQQQPFLPPPPQPPLAGNNGMGDASQPPPPQRNWRHTAPPYVPDGNNVPRIPYSPSMPPAPPRSQDPRMSGAENEFRDRLKRQTSSGDGVGGAMGPQAPSGVRRSSSNLTEIKLDAIPGLNLDAQDALASPLRHQAPPGGRFPGPPPSAPNAPPRGFAPQDPRGMRQQRPMGYQQRQQVVPIYCRECDVILQFGPGPPKRGRGDYGGGGGWQQQYNPNEKW